MRNILIILILGAVGYFIYQSLTSSSLVPSLTRYDQQIQGGDTDFAGGPISTGEAIRQINTDVNVESNNFFGIIMEKIRKWRIQINGDL